MVGKLNTALIGSIVTVVVVLVIVFQVVADTGVDVGSASGNVSATDTNASNGICDTTGQAGACAGDVLPLTSFFKPKGIILLAFMAGLALVVVKGVLGNKK